MIEPFFSVCIETENRGGSIFDAIMSVGAQSFRDIELIIVDNKSTDDTVSEIGKALVSIDVPYTFIEASRKLEGLENWNSPLLLAKGKYVAVLEGDDKYTPDHLQIAYEALSNNRDIGVYAGSNQLKNRDGGFFDSKEYTKKIVTLKSTPAPSELVFIRRSPTGAPYLFNVKDYQYCPEIELLLDIASDGFSAYYNQKKTIMRGVNHSRKEKDIWRYYRDHFVFLEQNADKMSKKQKDRTIELLSWRMLRQCLLKRIRS